MKKHSMFFAMCAVAILVVNALYAHSESAVQIMDSAEFASIYKGKPIADLISHLGDPSSTWKSMSGVWHYWDYDDTGKMPVKITDQRHDDYYCNRISARIWGKEKKIVELKFNYDKKLLNEEAEKRLAIQEMKQEEKRQELAKTFDKPLSIAEVMSNINENKRTSIQISDYRTATYGKYVEGVGVVTEVKRDMIHGGASQTKKKKSKSYEDKPDRYKYTLYVYTGDKKNAVPGFYNVKVATETDMSNVSLWQKIKFKGEFGPSTVGSPRQYVHLHNCDVELLK